MKWLLKILAGLVGLIVLAVIILFLSADLIARNAMASSIRAQTGLEVKIGRVEVGLIRPTLRVEDFTLYSAAEFGGLPMLVVPEVFLEYDREAAQRQLLHLRLLRLNLAELHIVEDASGRTNLLAIPGILDKLGEAAAGQQPHVNPGSLAVLPLPQGAITFGAIDTLNVSFGRIRLTSLKDPTRNRALEIGLQNDITRNVRSETNLYPLLFKIALRGGAELLSAPATVSPTHPRPSRR